MAHVLCLTHKHSREPMACYPSSTQGAQYYPAAVLTCFIGTAAFIMLQLWVPSLIEILLETIMVTALILCQSPHMMQGPNL